ncbi:MAG: EAL domain-containing protein [Thiotrichales bacterium]|nr:EAL domain-containing protein [Thiotrichales bacterium]
MDGILFEVVAKNGELKEVEVTGRISLASDNSKRTHCILLDVTEQRRADQQLRLAAKVFSNTGEGVMVTDHSCQIVSVNQAFSTILGYGAEEVIGKTPRFLRSGQHELPFYDAMWQEIKQQGVWQGEIWNRHKQGNLVPEWLTITALTNEHGEVENYIGVFADITKLKASQAELDYLAHHDVLTKLPNRRKFLNNLEFTLSHVKRSQKPFALLMLDLDRFKDVNDSYGHAAGDEVLLNAAKMIKDALRENDMVARLGGDEFAILIEDLHLVTDAAQVAQTIISTISKPQMLKDNRAVSVGCSIGIALYPEHGTDSEILMQHADSALYLSKKKSKGTFEYFTADMTESALQRMQIEADLKLALTNDELRVFYQPQVILGSNQIKGAEALIRWQHPIKGLLAPNHFIGIAEDSGLIADIGRWVLNETCRQAKVWYDQGFTQCVYAVNVSPKQLAYTNLLEVVMDALQATGLPAECLELEITESGLMGVGEEAVSLFESLRGLGVRIALDDFGTGYSSLSYLKTLPIDVLKVDKSFVDDIPYNEQGMQIVNTIIAMGHNLGLKVLAEGVEEDVQKRFLQLKGCDYYQGYLMSRPVPAEEFEARCLSLTSKF